MPPTPVVSARGEESRLWFLGTQTWIPVTTEQSGGALTIVENLVPAGMSSPWHVHRAQDETFYVVEGEVTVMVGDGTWSLAGGGCAFGPRGVPHGFRVEGEAPARLLLICTPGGGFDRFVVDAGEAASGPGFPPPEEPDVARLARLAAARDVEILGPLPIR